MAYRARLVEYSYTSLGVPSDEAYAFLTDLAGLGVNFLALTSVPIGPSVTQLTLFPEDPLRFRSAAKQANLTLQGPYPAVLVQGDDEIGALAQIHEKLRKENVDVYATSGVTDGKGYYGYILHVRPVDAERAVRALEG